MIGSLPQDAAARKASPMAEGLLWYFPNALAAVAAVSKAGNDQHNPGEPMHHARGKSMDHADCIMRHLVDAGTIDTDGQRHSAKVAWRALALLQEEIEREDGVPLPRNARADISPADALDSVSMDVPAAYTLTLDVNGFIHGEPTANDDIPERLSIADIAPKWSPQWMSAQGIPAESSYLASFSPNDMQAETLREYGIGDVPHRPNARNAHPMAAEALRDHDERLNGPEDKL